MYRMHLDIDDRMSLCGFRPEDRQDLVNGMNDWAVTRWLGRVLHPYRLIMPTRFLRQTNIFMSMRRYGTAAPACRWHFVTMTG